MFPFAAIHCGNTECVTMNGSAQPFPFYISLFGERLSTAIHCSGLCIFTIKPWFQEARTPGPDLQRLYCGPVCVGDDPGHRPPRLWVHHQGGGAEDGHGGGVLHFQHGGGTHVHHHRLVRVNEGFLHKSPLTGKVRVWYTWCMTAKLGKKRSLEVTIDW